MISDRLITVLVTAVSISCLLVGTSEVLQAVIKNFGMVVENEAIMESLTRKVSFHIDGMKIRMALEAAILRYTRGRPSESTVSIAQIEGHKELGLCLFQPI